MMRLLALFLYALNIHPNQHSNNATLCRLHTRTHFYEPQPVILKDDDLLEPTDLFGHVDIFPGESITLSCVDSGQISHPNAKAQYVTAVATCQGGESFINDTWLSAPAPFSLFRCPYPPNYSTFRTNRTCFAGNAVIGVGYIVNERFYAVYETCFDEVALTPIYSFYNQKPYNAMYQTRVDRPFFIDTNHYGAVPVEKLFCPWNQKMAVAQHVGNMTRSYFTKFEFLSRGHLAAKTDFVFAFGERATFHYINCAPQWTGFNGGNWNTLEVDLRNHIHDTDKYTMIYTGTFGVTKLNNTLGQRKNIYLYSDENNNPVIPVPQYFYKVVYEPSTKLGTVFIGINNPYYTLEEAYGLAFCHDQCRGNRAFSWLKWRPDSMAEGYGFCCTIPEFKITVAHLPNFEVVGLFT